MTEVYKIGVGIVLNNGASPILATIARDVMGVHTKVGDLEKGFGRVKLAIAGVVAIGAGLAIFASMKAPLEEARKFQMEMTKFGNFGLGAKMTNEAAQFAKGMDVMGSSYVDNMRRMSEAQGVFRDSGLSGEAGLRAAKMAAPILAKIDFANSALDDESRAKRSTSALAMMRFVEMRGGVNSPERFSQIADTGFKAITSSGGNINWEQLRQFAARAGVSGQYLNDDVLFGKLEPVIGELKGQTAGFALRTAFNRLNGITRLPNQVAHELADSGIWDAGKVVWNSQGGIKRFNGNPLRDSALFAHDPVAFYQQKVLPMYARMGLSPEERARQNSMIFGSTGGALFNLVDRQQPAIAKSVEAQRKALGINAAYGAAGGTLNGKMVDLHAKFANLMERLGEAILPLAVRGLNALIPAINAVTRWMAANPGKLAIFAKAAVVVGAALIGFGAAAIAVAAFAAVAAGGTVGIVVAGIGALLGALGALVVMNWGAITKAFDFVRDKIGGFFNWLIHGDGKQHPSFAQNFNAAMSYGDRSAAPLVSPGRASAKSGDVYLDGKKVGKVLAPHLAQQASGVAQGANVFDSRRHVALVGAGG